MTSYLNTSSNPLLTPQNPLSATRLQEISEAPLLPLNIPELAHTIKFVFISSLPIILCNLFTLVTGMISLIYIENYGSPLELAGASLATTWSFAFYFGIFNSANIGLQVTCSQLFGAQKHHELFQVLQKSLNVLAILSAPLLILVNIINKIASMSETEEYIGESSQLYLNCLIPSLISSCVSDSFKSFLTAQNYFYPQGIIQGIAVGLHIFWCHLFVVTLDLPLVGTAIARGITDITIAVSLYVYMRKTCLKEQIFENWSRAGEGWLSYFKGLLIIGANGYAQWVVYGISGLMISALNDEYVIGAHGIGSLLTAILFNMAVGNSVTMQTYLGNAVGSGCKYKGQKVIVAGLVLNICYSVINVLLYTIGNEFIADLMVEDPITKSVLKNIMYIYAAAHIADSSAEHIASVLRTVGKEDYVVRVAVICYFGIWIPLQWILGFGLEYGYIGLWGSLDITLYLVCALFTWKFICLDWDEAIATIKNKVEANNGEEANYVEMKESF